MNGWLSISFANKPRRQPRGLSTAARCGRTHGLPALAQQVTEDKARNIENTPRAFIGLFKGENLGKQIVKVA